MTELYIKITNEALSVGSDRKLNDKELYLYAYLAVKKGWNGEALMAYDILIGEIDLFDDAKESRLKKKIKDTVISLEKKGYISVQYFDKYFKATFKEVDENFTIISYNEMARLSDPLDFYIFTCVKRWDKAKYAYSVWAELLEKSESRTKTIIREAVERNVVYRLIGSYISEETSGYRKQDANTYSVTPFKVEELENQPKKKTMTHSDAIDTEGAKAQYPDYKIGQWFTKNLLSFYDFLEYWKRKEEADNGDELAKTFVEHCEREIAIQMTKKGAIPSTTKDNMEKSKSLFEKDKKQIQENSKANARTRAMADAHLRELNGEIDYDNIDYDNPMETPDDY